MSHIVTFCVFYLLTIILTYILRATPHGLSLLADDVGCHIILSTDNNGLCAAGANMRPTLAVNMSACVSGVPTLLAFKPCCTSGWCRVSVLLVGQYCRLPKWQLTLSADNVGQQVVWCSPYRQELLSDSLCLWLLADKDEVELQTLRWPLPEPTRMFQPGRYSTAWSQIRVAWTDSPCLSTLPPATRHWRTTLCLGTSDWEARHQNLASCALSASENRPFLSRNTDFHHSQLQLTMLQETIWLCWSTGTCVVGIFHGRNVQWELYWGMSGENKSAGFCLGVNSQVLVQISI